MNRLEERDWVFKLIYQDRLNEIDNLDKALENHELSDNKFIKDSIASYQNHHEEIENTLKEFLDKRYSRMSNVELAILFLSINEINYLDIPAPVSINEAVELTKTYADEGDYKLINSILGKIVRKNNA